MTRFILKNNLFVNNDLILTSDPIIIPKNLLSMANNYPLKYRYTKFVSSPLEKNKQILIELEILLST